MIEKTKISWTDYTFNGWRGCDKVSAGCKNCYAEINTPSRVARAKGIETWGKNAARIVASKAQWDDIRRLNKKSQGLQDRPKVFCHSLSDVFEDYKGGNVCDHNGVKMHDTLDPVRCILFKLIMDCPNLDFLLLTKRPENVKQCLIESSNIAYGPLSDNDLTSWLEEWIGGNPPDNVWLGTSVEDQKTADKRILELIKVPARIHFLSCEPLLGPVDMALDEVSGRNGHATIDWVICGGESGHNAREMDIEWARCLYDECDEQGVPFFMKQLGGKKDKRESFDLFPEDLKVREFPA